jgi:uncharacterized protein (TIGR03437 family)
MGRKLLVNSSMGCKANVLFAIFFTVSAASAQTTLTVVSAASGSAVVSPDALVSAFGSGLTNQTLTASVLPLPTELGGISVQVSDGAGVSRAAGILFVSPSQVNFVMPAGEPSGTATILVSSGSNLIARGTAQIQAVAPALFAASGTGKGVAAATAVRLIGGPGGPTSVFPVFLCDAPVSCQPVSLNVGIDTPTTIEFFGTGIRGGSNVTATIGGQTVPVAFAGAQGQFPGLDQVNLPLLLSLRGAGLADVVVTVDGQPSNPVQILIQ